MNVMMPQRQTRAGEAKEMIAMKKATQNQMRKTRSSTMNTETTSNETTAAGRSSDEGQTEELAAVKADDGNDHSDDQPNVNPPYLDNAPASEELPISELSSRSQNLVEKAQAQIQDSQCTGPSIGEKKDEKNIRDEARKSDDQFPQETDTAMPSSSATPEIRRSESRASSEEDFDVADDDDNYDDVDRMSESSDSSGLEGEDEKEFITNGDKYIHDDINWDAESTYEIDDTVNFTAKSLGINYNLSFGLELYGIAPVNTTVESNSQTDMPPAARRPRWEYNPNWPSSSESVASIDTVEDDVQRPSVSSTPSVVPSALAITPASSRPPPLFPKDFDDETDIEDSPEDAVRVSSVGTPAALSSKGKSARRRKASKIAAKVKKLDLHTMRRFKLSRDRANAFIQETPRGYNVKFKYPPDSDMRWVTVKKKCAKTPNKTQRPPGELDQINAQLFRHYHFSSDNALQHSGQFPLAPEFARGSHLQGLSRVDQLPLPPEFARQGISESLVVDDMVLASDQNVTHEQVDWSILDAEFALSYAQEESEETSRTTSASQSRLQTPYCVNPPNPLLNSIDDHDLYAPRGGASPLTLMMQDDSHLHGAIMDDGESQASPFSEVTDLDDAEIEKLLYTPIHPRYLSRPQRETNTGSGSRIEGQAVGGARRESLSRKRQASDEPSDENATKRLRLGSASGVAGWLEPVSA